MAQAQKTARAEKRAKAAAGKTALAPISPLPAADWLAQYREKNLRIFNARPVKKSKYSSIPRLESLLAKPGGGAKNLVPKISGAPATVLGFDEALKTMPEKLRQILEKEETCRDQFGAFVNANFSSGFVVVVGKECDGKTIRADLAIPDGACAKGFFIIEKGVKATIVEKISGSGASLYAQTVSIEDGANACVARLHLASGGIIDYQQCIAGNGSALVNSNAWFGGGLVRANADIILDGEGCRAEDFSVLLCEGREQFDLNYSSIHRAAGSFSHNIFNSCLKDGSRCVYDGMIRIEESASKTNALLETHSMILGSQASSNQIPQLEIKTDDVKATHSATVAHIEDDELFYLQAKGIPGKQAKKMVVLSFLETVVLKLPEIAREGIIENIERKL